MIDVVCQKCGDFYQVDDREAGFRVPCPGCRAPNRVSSPSATPTAVATPSAAPTPPVRQPSAEWQVLRLALYILAALFAIMIVAGFGGGGRDIGIEVVLASSIGLAVCLAGLAASCRRWIGE